MRDFGTVRPGTTLYIPFATYDSNDPSASVTLTGLATTDIEVYKDGSVTQRASDAGYALLDTDGIDFDGITGIHGCSIDLADNTTAGFWSAGSQYWVVVSSITVDAATINFIAATFRIGYEDAILNTTIATLASQTSFTLTDGPAEDDALNGCQVVIHDVASKVQVGRAIVSDYTGATKTVTLAAATTFTAAATDNIAVLGLAPLQPAVAGRTLGVESDGDLTKVNTLDGHTAQTGDNFARLGAPAGASVSADIAAIEAQTDDIGAAGAGLTAVPWNAAWDAEVQSEVQDAIEVNHLDHLLAADYDPASKPGVATALLNELVESDAGVSRYTANALEQAPTGSAPSAATIADAVWDEAAADHVAAGSTGERVERLDVIASGGSGGLTNARAANLDNLDAAISTRATPAQVNTEVLDVLNVDTFAEPGQEAPAATNTLVKKLGYLFKFLRNKITSTATETKVFADDGTTVDQKSTVSDDATTYTRGEFGTGP